MAGALPGMQAVWPKECFEALVVCGARTLSICLDGLLQLAFHCGFIACQAQLHRRGAIDTGTLRCPVEASAGCKFDPASH